jgi:hypothetical protein
LEQNHPKIKVKSKETVSKPSEEKNNYDSMDMEALQRIVKKLSNELIYLKKSGGEGSSSQNKFFRFLPRKIKILPQPIKPTLLKKMELTWKIFSILTNLGNKEYD